MRAQFGSCERVQVLAGLALVSADVVTCKGSKNGTCRQSDGRLDVGAKEVLDEHANIVSKLFVDQ